MPVDTLRCFGNHLGEAGRSCLVRIPPSVLKAQGKPVIVLPMIQLSCRRILGSLIEFFSIDVLQYIERAAKARALMMEILGSIFFIGRRLHLAVRELS